jgi:putative redox protein
MMLVMATMTASARSTGGTLRHEIDVNGRHTLITDEPETLGGADSGPAPHELLPAMLAACVSTMIVLYGRSRDWSMEGVRVDIEYDTDPSPRQVRIEIHLPDGFTESQIKRLRRVADTCPVKRALQAGFTFEEQIVFATA